MTIVASNSITISNVNDGTIVHIAYANSADGKNGFYVGGGSNYLRDSDKSISGWAQDLGTIPNEVLNYLAGKTITISVDAEWSDYQHSDSKKNRLGFELAVIGSDGKHYWYGAWKYPETPSGKERVSTTFTLPANVTFTVNNNGKNGYVSINGTGRVSHVKLEEGSVATPWVPAIEDNVQPKYMGTYTDYTQGDSLDPTAYQWSQIKGVDGKDGLGIKSTIITYQLSSSGTTTPTGTWLTTVPTLTKGQYLWTRTTLIYTDNTNEDVYSVSYIAKDGNNGTDGVAGKAGVGIKSTTITYQSGTSGTVQPTGTWVANPPSVTGGNYLWTRTVWSYTDGTTETGYSVGHIGANGATGKDGVGVKSTTITYQASTSGTTAPTGTWVANPPSVADGKYLWTQTTWLYTDGTSKTGYSVAKIGEKGDKGDQGIPGATGDDGKTSYLHIAYANNADGSGCTTSPDINSSYNYIGTYTDYTSTSSTNPSSYKWVAMFDSTKKRNFTTQPTTPYAVGDTWTQANATYFCKTARDSGAFTASDWTMQQLTIQSLDSSVTNNLYNDNLFQGSQLFTGQAHKMRSQHVAVTLEDYDSTTKMLHVVSNGTTSNSSGIYWVFPKLDNGTAWTFSADMKGSGLIRSMWRENSTPMTGQHQTLTNDWVRYSNTGTLTDNSHGAWCIYFDNTSVKLDAYIKLIKVEKGSSPTPWCLSQSEITTTTKSYKGVTLNDSGLTATAGSTKVTVNSTDGFLIDKGTTPVFHVDTTGNLTMQGNITAGNISGVNFTGNSLNLNTTLAIGANGVLSANGGKTVINNSGLTIKDGGLSIEDSKNNQTTYIGNDGTFITNKGVFVGDVTTNKLILKGNDSDINLGGGKFHVDKDGKLTANSATLADGTVNSSVINGSQFLAGDTYLSLLDGDTHNNVSLSSTGTLVGGSYHSSLYRVDYITLNQLTANTQNTGTSVANISSPDLFTVDGSKLSNGDKILVKLSINYNNYIGKLGTKIALQSKTSSPILFSEQSMNVGYYTYNFIINWSSSLGTGKVIFNLKGIGLQANSNFYVVGARFYTNHGGSGDNYYESTTALRSDGTLSLKDYFEEVNSDGASKYYNGFQWDQGELSLSHYEYNYNTGGGVSNLNTPYYESNLSSEGLKFIGGNSDPNLEFFGDVSHEAIMKALGYAPWGVSYNGARNLANGVWFDKWGNIHGYTNSNNWNINGLDQGTVASFPLNNKNDINLNPPKGYGLKVNGSITTPWGINGYALNGFKMSGNNIKAAYGSGFYLDNAGGAGGNADLHVKSVVQSSLLSLKTNISEIDSGTALDLINQTEIYDYQFKDDVTNGVTKHYASYIIDDVNDKPQYTEPDIFVSNDGKGRDDGSLLAYSVLAIQELSNRINNLESIINSSNGGKNNE